MYFSSPKGSKATKHKEKVHCPFPINPTIQASVVRTRHKTNVSRVPNKQKRHKTRWQGQFACFAGSKGRKSEQTNLRCKKALIGSQRKQTTSRGVTVSFSNLLFGCVIRFMRAFVTAQPLPKCQRVFRNCLTRFNQFPRKEPTNRNDSIVVRFQKRVSNRNADARAEENRPAQDHEGLSNGVGRLNQCPCRACHNRQ